MGKLTTVFLILALAAAAWWLGAWDKIKPHFSGGASSIQLPSVTGLHKCVAGAKVLYTDGVCPTGYAAGAVKGSMTVLPAIAAPAIAAPAANSSTKPNATNAMGSPNTDLIKQKMVERAVGE